MNFKTLMTGSQRDIPTLVGVAAPASLKTDICDHQKDELESRLGTRGLSPTHTGIHRTKSLPPNLYRSKKCFADVSAEPDIILTTKLRQKRFSVSEKLSSLFSKNSRLPVRKCYSDGGMSNGRPMPRKIPRSHTDNERLKNGSPELTANRGVGSDELEEGKYTDRVLVSEQNFGTIKVVVEFYRKQAEEKMDSPDGSDLMTGFRKGRRSCVVSALELGESETQLPEESSDSKVYPGDLVLHNGLALRHPSPPTVNGGSENTDHYGSEGSLIDTGLHISQTPPKDGSDSRRKMKKDSFFKGAPWKGRKATPDLEYVLIKMKPTEFRDERLASNRHSRWQTVLNRSHMTSSSGSTLEEMDEISASEQTRRDAIWEIFTNECTFLVDHLMVLKHCFMEPLKKCQVEGFLMDVDPSKLFGNLDELCDLSYRFCRDYFNDLRASSESESSFASTDCLCNCLDTMTLNSRDGDIYHSYLLNYRSALTYLDILRNTLEDYALYERFCEQDARCNKLRLSDLLVAPMQHWTRLPLILQRVRKYTKNEAEVNRLDECIEKVVSSLKTLENKMEWLKTFERVKEIETQLVWPTITEIDAKAYIPDSLRGVLGVQPMKNLLDDKIREITYEGPLMLAEKDKTTDAYIFLFTDFLLFTKQKKEVKKARGRMSTTDKHEGCYQVLRQPIPVSSLSVHDIGATEASALGMKNLFVVVQRSPFQQVIGVFSLQAHTSLGKQKWLTHLRDSKGKTIEINNNRSCELVSRQRSFRDIQETSHSNLLKYSQVLEMTNSMTQSKSIDSSDGGASAETSDTSHLSPPTTTSTDKEGAANI